MLARAARVSILRALRRLPAARALSSTKKDDDDSTAVLDATIDQLVSRKGLYKVGERPKGPLQGDAAKSKSPVTPLIDELYKQITIRGPLTTAEYIRQCLYHPQYGYYMTRQPFGRQGDFVTSPEISQVFGELLCIWCVAQWQQMGKPSSFRLVELGPGRGTLMADFLRTAQKFPDFLAAINVHFVELSILNIRQQQAKLEFEKCELFAPAEAVAAAEKADQHAKTVQQDMEKKIESEMEKDQSSKPVSGVGRDAMSPSVAALSALTSSSSSSQLHAAAAQLAASTRVGRNARIESLYKMVPVPVPYITSNYTIFANVLLEQPESGGKQSTLSSTVHSAAAAAAIASPISGIVPTTATKLVKDWAAKKEKTDTESTDTETIERIYLSGRSKKFGVPLHWHPFLSNVPSGPILLIAQEFFDALPVHQFVYTERGWLERLVDVDVTPAGEHHLRYVLSSTQTPACAFVYKAAQMTKFPANAFSNNQCVPGETQSARPTASAAGKTVITNLSSFSDASGQKVSSATTDPRFSVEANELANAQIRARFEAATRKAESKVLGHDGNQASSTDSKSKSTDGASTSPLSAAIAAAAARRVRGAGGSSTAENANAQLMLHPPNATQIEIGGESLALGEEIGKRIQQYGGAALIIDYGDDHVHASSLQGVKQHTKKHVLEESGTVDLSSHVDFCALKNVAVADRGGDVNAYGPISQGRFLQSMGIETRLRMLLEAVVERRPGSGVAADATDEVVDAAQDRLISACQRLVEPEQMGQLFKVLCIASKNCGLPPAFETSSKATGAAAATSTADVPPVL